MGMSTLLRCTNCGAELKGGTESDECPQCHPPAATTPESGGESGHRAGGLPPAPAYSAPAFGPPAYGVRAAGFDELPPRTTVPQAQARERVGPYVLLEKLGEGGMGVVYKAEQRTPVRRVVALKLVKPGMSSKEVVARFGAERQALALMNHPHVA